MEGSIKDLSKYRFESALEDLDCARAIFHALRSVTALDQFDSGKHSGIIAYFNRTYIKEGVFTKVYQK